jgi:hypothetical protein
MDSNDTKDREDVRFRLTRFDQQIFAEFELVGHRMNWLMTSQAFLFGAFALCVTSNLPRAQITLYLQFILLGIGIVSAGAVGLAILAAHRVVNRLKPMRAILEAKASAIGYENLGVDISSYDHRAGNLPPMVLPWMLIAAWLILLLVAIG